MTRVWHVAMAAAMVAMLVLPVRRETAAAELLLFSVGLAWCASRLAAGRMRGVHVRLAVGFVAMLVMLVPSALAPAPAGVPGMDMAGMAGMHGAHAGLPAWLTVVLMVAMVGACWPEGLRRLRSPGGTA
jgi:hypothetical protein